MPSDDIGWGELHHASSSSASTSSSSSSSEDGEGEEVGIGVARERRSFSYYRLPDHLLWLSVLKLDGTSFDVEVARSASVAELKIAVEDVFKQSHKEYRAEISWGHVWGHFCLGYEGYKLLDDKTSLRSIGIKDGDQLHFMRHLSIDHNPNKRKLRNHGTVLTQNRMSLSRPGVLEENEEDDKDKSSDSEDKDCHNNENDDDLIGNAESRLAPYRGAFSYFRLWSSRRDKSHSKTHFSKVWLKLPTSCVEGGVMVKEGVFHQSKEYRYSTAD